MSTIEIKESQIIPAINAAYNLSVPVGMGFLHYTPEPLTSEELNELAVFHSNSISLDYVKGRGVKFNIFRETVNGEYKYYIREKWFDHSEDQVLLLLKAIE